ncbi:DUF5996 family protein [Noviherbaspirillum massiliense]|uniref:DUF5996 family protein n=1 Tax=Noviherbaspirillum massiliense TaxID=1465823 RepID=UPI00035F3267|nr:DUF5996 family protein [Noviherbaspirillum massiliense]
MMQPSSPGNASRPEHWPALDFKSWKDTYATLHMWTQIVGKIRLACSPWTNHSWHVPLYVTVRGLTTSPISHGARAFQIDFDFIEHQLVIQTDDGRCETLPLKPQPVADFYREVCGRMARLGLDVTINTTPNEVADAIPFEEDRVHASYDAEAAHRCWRAMLQADRVFKEFRARFIGKCSPVHFFWGSFDLAVTRFSGRPAPEHPGGVPHLPDWVAREAYSHEVSSCGFWPGSAALPSPVFYSYAYPEPEGFNAAPLLPGRAVYDSTLREFILPYEVVRRAESPDATLLDFLQGSFDAAARLAHWDSSVLRGPELSPHAS